jgi:hypothetical protein
MPSGRPARVPHQGTVLRLWWSDLDDVKLVLGLLDVYVKVVLLRGVLTAILANLMIHSHSLRFLHFGGALHVVVISKTAPDVHQGDASHG